MSDESRHSEQQSETTTATEQAVITSACPHPEAVGKRWGDPISERQQRELQQVLSDWNAIPEEDRGEVKGPFNQVGSPVLTGADIFWLAARALADDRGERGDAAIAKAMVLLRTTMERKLSLPVPTLTQLHLEQASLRGAHLEEAYLLEAHLEEADLRDAHAERAILGGAHLEDAHLEGARLEGAVLNGAHLQGAFFQDAHLDGAKLESANLRGAFMEGLHMEGAHLQSAGLEGAVLQGARLLNADLTDARLSHARLNLAYLEGASLRGAQLEGASLRGTHLDSANLSGASFDKTSHLNDAVLPDASFDQVTFDNTNLTVVDWSQVIILGDERTARERKDSNGKPKKREQRLDDYKAAVRANRVLAVALRNQGLSEDADRFAYRAQLLQQQVLRRQRKFGGYVFSRILDGLAGYGYKPVRGLIAYVLVILGFAFAYGLATHGILTFGLAPSSIKPLQWYEALVLSISSFHGRGFFQPVQSLGDPVAIIAAAEAIIGLLIEISFIATFTQRFFGR